MTLSNDLLTVYKVARGFESLSLCGEAPTSRFFNRGARKNSIAPDALRFRRRKYRHGEQSLGAGAQGMRCASRNRHEVARLDLAFLAGDSAGRLSLDHVDELVALMTVFVIVAESGRNRKH